MWQAGKVACYALLFLTAGCAERIPIKLTPASYSQLDGWNQNNASAALATFLKSCEAIHKKSATATLGCGDLKSPASNWHSICVAAKIAAVSDPALDADMVARQFFETHFLPYRVSSKDTDTGLFTGDYIPEIKGSRTQMGAYQTPVYRMPPDVEKGVAYFTRAEIYAGALEGKGLEIAWVEDPVQLFFIEIQGSGVIRLTDGSTLTIGFAGKNNREYIAIGRVMGDENMLDKDNINLFTIKEWLYQNPEKARGVMERNPSFVFFQEMKDGMVRGAQGVGLTPEQSMAIDWHYYPYGLPIYLNTTLPQTRFGPETEFRRIMIAQDTGGAIRGGIRGDIYFGYGERAEALAGHQAERGTMSVLLPPHMVSDMDLERVMPCAKK